MPRNCECSSKCTCIVRAGTGTEVTGTGQPENPYIINADTGGGDGSGFETGDLKWTARPSAPAGWLVCDGAAVSRTTYAALFAAISTVHGPGDGATTFNLPDFTGKFMLGSDGSHVLGSSGGSETRTLTAAQMPAHTHASGSAGTHDHAMSRNDTLANTTSIAATGQATGAVVGSRSLIQADGAHAHSIGTTGGGQSFSVLPPYSTALPLVKT